MRWRGDFVLLKIVCMSVRVIDDCASKYKCMWMYNIRASVWSCSLFAPKQRRILQAKSLRVPISLKWMSFACQEASVNGANLVARHSSSVIFFLLRYAPSRVPCRLHLMWWNWFSRYVHCIDMRHWLQILTMSSSQRFTLTSTMRASAFIAPKVNKVSFLLAPLTTGNKQ